MIKSFIAFLAASVMSSVTYANNSNYEFLGQCDIREGGIFQIYQNPTADHFKFKVEDSRGTREMILQRDLTWLWYEVDASYWKYRNGRNNGVFSWNFNTGIGHLKYVDGEYFYWNFVNCDINEKAVYR